MPMPEGKPKPLRWSDREVSLRKACVLGAGLMGSQIAAHLANARIPVLLLDRTAPEDAESRNPAARSKLAIQGIKRAGKMNPPAFFLPDLAMLITPGNFEDHLEKISEADWIIEAVSEDLEIKQTLFQKIANARNPHSIVSTNTSGIPIAEIARGMDEHFQSHFLGTHFFNPPRYMKLLEIIPTAKTAPGVAEAIAAFAQNTLGKGTILCNDTPGFIANRVGTFAVGVVLKIMEELGLSIEEVDDLTGTVVGHPKSATFRTLDLVGLDTFFHVAQNLHQALSSDPFRDYFKLPDFVLKMVEGGFLGEKTGHGFYKKTATGEILTLDLTTLEYRPRHRAHIASVEMARGSESLEDRLRTLFAARDKGGEFFRRTTAAIVAYAAGRIPETSDTPESVDKAMEWGFGWALGPFSLWDTLGHEKTLKVIAEQKLELPSWAMEIIHSAGKKFYDPLADSRPQFINLAKIKARPEKIVAQNSGASLLDLGDRVLCLEFHSKMNAIGDDTLQMASRALRLLEGEFHGLVIGNQGDNFCVGANLMLLLMLAREGEWDELEGAVRRFQKLNMQIKYAPAPVVAAPFNRALGGGCEIVLHCAKACAHVESYIGLVELGAGLIPAGGGTKEMISRTMKHAAASGADPLKAFQKTFETIAMARVSGSADEARRLGYLREEDEICMNRDSLIHAAKRAILHLSEQNYHPPAQEKIKVPGKPLHANLLAGIYLMQEARRITEYETHLAKKLAFLISGGDFSSSQEVSEQYLLDLERETFLSLVRERKSQERMQHLLKHGKPLRN